jgi:hypothetical protein
MRRSAVLGRVPEEVRKGADDGVPFPKLRRGSLDDLTSIRAFEDVNRGTANGAVLMSFAASIPKGFLPRNHL